MQSMIPSAFYVLLDLTMKSMGRRHAEIVQKERPVMEKVQYQKKIVTVSYFQNKSLNCSYPIGHFHMRLKVIMASFSLLCKYNIFV